MLQSTTKGLYTYYSLLPTTTQVCVVSVLIAAAAWAAERWSAGQRRLPCCSSSHALMPGGRRRRRLDVACALCSVLVTSCEEIIYSPEKLPSSAIFH
jgi:hypothetical protein